MADLTRDLAYLLLAQIALMFGRLRAAGRWLERNLAMAIPQRWRDPPP